MSKRLGNSVVAALALGCAPALLQPTAEDAARVAPLFPGTTVEDLARGRAGYVAKCSGCHPLFLPETRTADVWREEVREMAARASLTDTQITDITRYLVALASPG